MSNPQLPLSPLPLEERGLAVAIPLPQSEKIGAAARTLRVFIIGSLLAILLFFAFRNAPLKEIIRSIRHLQLWQIAVLILINIAIYILITLRWWIIVRAENRNIALLPLIAVRMAAFGVSYLTIGPQVGGELLQILYLQQNPKMTYTRAASTVVMDKLLEFFANFFLLAIGLTAALQAGILSTSGSKSFVSLIGLIILLLWPPIHIFLLYHGKYPVSAFTRMVMRNKFTRFISALERMAGMFCRRHLPSLMSAILVSLFAAICMIGEYFFITIFLHIKLSIPQTIAAWMAGWLAFLIPLPGGLGALEASQVFALGTFGITAAGAIGVALLIRARDLCIGALGLLFAGHGVSKYREYDSI